MTNANGRIHQIENALRVKHSAPLRLIVVWHDDLPPDDLPDDAVIIRVRYEGEDDNPHELGG